MNLLQPAYNAVSAARGLMAPPPAAPGTTLNPSPAPPPPTAAAPTSAPGYEQWATIQLAKMGGQRLSGADHRNGWVFKNGMTVEQANAQLLQQWNSMTPAQRASAAQSSTPSRNVSSPAPAGGLSAPPMAPSGSFSQAPPVGTNGRGFTGLGNMPSPTSSLATPPMAPRDMSVEQDARTGITRSPNGAVTTSGGGVVSAPAASGSRTLTSPFGTGSVTFPQAGQPRPPATFTNMETGQKGQSMAQATGVRAGLAVPPPAPSGPAAPAPPPSMLAQGKTSFDLTGTTGAADKKPVPTSFDLTSSSDPSMKLWGRETKRFVGTGITSL